MHDFYDAHQRAAVAAGSTRGFHTADCSASKGCGRPADVGQRIQTRPARLLCSLFRFMAHITSIPMANNTVALIDHRDHWGRPALRLTHQEHPDDAEAKQWFRSHAGVDGSSWRNASGISRSFRRRRALARRRAWGATHGSPSSIATTARTPPNLFICDGQPRDERPRTADDDDSGSGVSRRRSHRAVRSHARDLTRLTGQAAIVYGSVTAARIRWIIPSIDPWCQCHTKTISCSGSIQIVFEPLPIAAKLDAGALGHCRCLVFSHQR